MPFLITIEYPNEHFNYYHGQNMCVDLLYLHSKEASWVLIARKRRTRYKAFSLEWAVLLTDIQVWNKKA